jgi:hypothetical protein
VQGIPYPEDTQSETLRNPKERRDARDWPIMAAVNLTIRLRDDYLPVCGIQNAGPVNARQSTELITLQGLTSVEDFRTFECEYKYQKNKLNEIVTLKLTD